MLAYVLAVVVIAVAALLAFGLAALMGLQGGLYWGFVLALSILGIAAAVVILVLHFRARKEKEFEGDAGAGDSSDLGLLLSDANRKLRSSQQGAKTLNSLPLFYILGDAGAAKTTTIVQSGLDPELLAGSASPTVEQTPTQVLNLWFSRQAAFLEVGAAIRASNALFERLVQRTRAKAHRSAFGTGAAPRAVIVCLSMDQVLLADGGTALMASARATGAQLRDLSRLLGMPIPVYVIVTKLDLIRPFFEKYVRNLSDEEVKQVVGSPIPRSETSVGTYADTASKSLATVIDGIVYQLGEFRLEVLDRESDPRNSSGDYEFPREFGKVRKALNQYLVELCKPSQLSANPYLRGIFFTGVRPRSVERAAVVPQAPQRFVEQEAGVTQIFRPGQGGTVSRAAAAPAMPTSRVPQWVFLPRLLPEVILGDKIVLAASRQTAPARLFRRILFGSIAFLFALYCLCLVISYVNNASLESRISHAARVLPSVSEAAETMPSQSELQALDELRKIILLLDRYQQKSAPWGFRFGLYQGEKLDREARNIYFDRFRPRLLNPAQANLISFMSTLPDAPAASAANDSNSYNSAYDPLRAFLITTRNPEKSQSVFLTPILLQRWKGTSQVDEDREHLASTQFDFYANELLHSPPPYPITQDAAAEVDHARNYLANFLASTRIYQAMLTDADKASPSIDFNKQYPGSSSYVVDSHVVRGAFTHDGYARMQDDLKHPERFANGEPWVLGDAANKSSNTASGSGNPGSDYAGQFLAEWQQFLASARVVNCESLPDASSRLTVLQGASSPLLELFYTISHNTAVADPQISSLFQPAQQLVPPNATDHLVGPGNKPYVDALLQLAGAVDLNDKNPNVTKDPVAFSPISTQIVAANTAAQTIAQNFTVDPKAQTGDLVLKLMQAPIQCVKKFEPSPGAAGNGAGQNICNAINPLLGRFPFSQNKAAAPASLQEVDRVFAPESGIVATNYKDLSNILVPSGAHYVQAPNPPGKVNQHFVTFFEHIERISNALYSGGAKSATLTFTLRFIPGNQVSNAAFVIDGQHVPSGSNSQTFNWVGSTAQKVSLLVDNNEIPPDTGTWSLFQMVREAQQTTRIPGGYRLEYPLNNTTTIAGRTTVNGSGSATKTATFELTGPGAEFLVGDGFTGLSCAQPVIFK